MQGLFFYPLTLFPDQQKFRGREESGVVGDGENLQIRGRAIDAHAHRKIAARGLTEERNAVADVE